MKLLPILVLLITATQGCNPQPTSDEKWGGVARKVVANKKLGSVARKVATKVGVGLPDEVLASIDKAVERAIKNGDKSELRKIINEGGEISGGAIDLFQRTIDNNMRLLAETTKNYRDKLKILLREIPKTNDISYRMHIYEHLSEISARTQVDQSRFIKYFENIRDTVLLLEMDELDATPIRLKLFATHDGVLPSPHIEEILNYNREITILENRFSDVKKVDVNSDSDLPKNLIDGYKEFDVKSFFDQANTAKVNEMLRYIKSSSKPPGEILGSDIQIQKYLEDSVKRM